MHKLSPYLAFGDTFTNKHLPFFLTANGKEHLLKASLFPKKKNIAYIWGLKIAAANNYVSMKKYQLLAVLTILLCTCFGYSTFACKAENLITNYKYKTFLKAPGRILKVHTQPRPSYKKSKATANAYYPVPDSYHTVSTATLNVRSRPSMNSSVVKKLRYKDKVVIIESTDAKWVKVQAGAVTGYTLRKSLSLW